MANEYRNPEIKTQYTTESAVVYCFDFTDFPEIEQGETISSTTMTAVANVTFGTPAVLVAAFSEIFDGVTTTVAIGKGVKVAVTCTTTGTYTIPCNAVMSGGTTRTKRLTLIVK